MQTAQTAKIREENSKILLERALAIKDRLGMTQEEMAREVGVCWTTVNRWARGHTKYLTPSIKKLLGQFIEKYEQIA